MYVFIYVYMYICIYIYVRMISRLTQYVADQWSCGDAEYPPLCPNVMAGVAGRNLNILLTHYSVLIN